MAIKTFGLAILISLINGKMFNDTEQADVDEVVSHIHNGEASVTDPDSVDRAISFITQNHPKVVQASELMAHVSAVDGERWKKLGDLYRWSHQVGSLEPEMDVRERAREEEQELDTVF